MSMSAIPKATSIIDDIIWDGLDDNLNNIGTGVYVYKIIVKADDGTENYKSSKLVVLK